MATSPSRTPTHRPAKKKRVSPAIPILLAVALLLTGAWAIKTWMLDGGRPKNILLMGVDENKTRTDVVVLAHLEPKDGTVNLISLPRDTWLDIPCRDLDPCQTPDKLAHAHVWGGDKGPELAVQTVEKFLGVKIDGYVRVDFQGFSKVVDAIGGVDIVIDQNMYYEDPTPPGLVINFKASPEPQHLDGKKALEYVRFRNDGQGDVGRTDRTRKFLKAVMDGVKQRGLVGQLPSLYSSLSPYVKTDLDSGTVASIARMASKMDSTKIHMDMVPGTPVILKSGPWVWQADVEKTQVLVDTMIKMKKAPEPAK